MNSSYGWARKPIDVIAFHIIYGEPEHLDEAKHIYEISVNNPNVLKTVADRINVLREKDDEEQSKRDEWTPSETWRRLNTAEKLFYLINSALERAKQERIQSDF